MSKDQHAQGEKDANRDSGRNSFAEVVSDQITGSGSHNPPSGHDGKENYQSGWNNAKDQSSKK